MNESSAAAQPLLGAPEYMAYEAELLRLRGIPDRDLPERLREARGFVAADTAEEIAHIQEDRTVMDARTARLEDLLHTATVVPDGAASDLVTLGVTAEVAYPRARRRATYRLTGTGSASDGGAVSARSPIARALMGRRAGDVVSAHLPGGGIVQLEILGNTAGSGGSVMTVFAWGHGPASRPRDAWGRQRPADSGRRDRKRRSAAGCSPARRSSSGASGGRAAPQSNRH